MGHGTKFSVFSDSPWILGIYNETGPMLKERRITRYELMVLDRFAFKCLYWGLFVFTPWPWLKDVVERWVDPGTGDYVFLVEEKKDECAKVAQ